MGFVDYKGLDLDKYIYHLWVMPKGFKLPFGIHVKRDKQCEVINRGCPKDITRLVNGSAEIRGIK